MMTVLHNLMTTLPTIHLLALEESKKSICIRLLPPASSSNRHPRPLPERKGKAMAYFYISENKKQTYRKMSNEEKLMWLFTKVVTENFLSEACANSILTWARELVTGNDALLACLPQYTTMKRRLEKYTKLRGYDIHRFRTQIELHVDPDFNSGESTTTFYFTDPLAVAAEIIGNPNIVSQKQHFHKQRLLMLRETDYTLQI